MKLLIEERTRDGEEVRRQRKREEEEARRTEDMQRLTAKREEDMQRQIELLTKLVGEKKSGEDGHSTGTMQGGAP